MCIFGWHPVTKSDVADSREIAGDKTGLSISKINNVANWIQKRYNPKNCYLQLILELSFKL